MAKNIKNVKCVSSKNDVIIHIPGERVVIKPDEPAYFGVVWEDGYDYKDMEQPVTWFSKSSDKKEIIGTETCAYPQIYKFEMTRMMCGSYTYYIEAGLSATPDSNTSKGMYVNGFCEPKIITSKWSIEVDGEDVRKTHQFSYGDRINLSVETEGLNGDKVKILVYRQFKGGDGSDDDTLVSSYYDATVADGEINVTFGNTYNWMGSNPDQEELFWVKIISPAGVEVTDGKDIEHGRYLRIKNVISNTKEIHSTNNTAVKIGNTDKSAERISNAVVYFRPTVWWEGEFGFDWLREEDNGLAETSDPAYANIIEGGYLDGFTDLTKGPEGTAFTKLKNEYEKLPMFNTGHSVSEYFVPHMTLFSRSFTSLPEILLLDEAKKPKFEAKLKVLVSISKPIDRLEFEYDTSVLKVCDVDDNEIKTLKDKMPTSGLIRSQNVTIKIVCNFDLAIDKEIKVYCYPINGQPRTLAGKILLLSNNVFVRNEMKFVLVNVTTNVKNAHIEDIVKGKFKDLEKIKFYNVLHQALVLPIVEERDLDLSQDPDFQRRGIYVDGKNIAIDEKKNEPSPEFTLHAKLKSLFWFDKNADNSYKNTNLLDHFPIFKFGVESNINRLLGEVEGIGKKNAIAFTIKDSTRDQTLVHEVLHGLGLNHTHRDEKPITSENYRYVYPCALKNGDLQKVPQPTKSTDNIMSYREITKSTWRWQWSIINHKISDR